MVIIPKENNSSATKEAWKFESYNPTEMNLINENVEFVGKWTNIFPEFKTEVDTNFTNRMNITVPAVNKQGKYNLTYSPPTGETNGILKFDMQGKGSIISGSGLKTGLSEFFSGAQTGGGTVAPYLESEVITDSFDITKTTTLSKDKLIKINKASFFDAFEFYPLYGLFKLDQPNKNFKVKFIYQKDGMTYEKVEILNIIK